MEIILASTQAPRCASTDVLVRAHAAPAPILRATLPDRLMAPFDAAEAAREYARDMARYQQLADLAESARTGRKIGTRTTTPQKPSPPRVPMRATATHTCPHPPVMAVPRSAHARRRGPVVPVPLPWRR